MGKRKQPIITKEEFFKNKKQRVGEKSEVNAKKNKQKEAEEEQQEDFVEENYEQEQEEQNPEKQEFASPEESRSVISKYHTLNKYMESIIHHPTMSKSEKEAKQKEIQKQIDELGGLEKYQKASVFGESTDTYKQFNSGKWVVKELKERKMHLPATQSPGAAETVNKIKLLDVGALTNHFLNYKAWIDTTPIDLNPQHESVIKADFFEYTKSLDTKYDVVVLSLVVNFVGDPRRRGEMLVRCKQLLPENTGLLFIVLPLACIENSRYVNHELFVELMDAIDFRVAKHKFSKKLAMYICERKGKVTKPADDDDEEDNANEGEEVAEQDEESATSGGAPAVSTVSLSPAMKYAKFTKRVLCRGGQNRNNFCIMLPSKSKKNATFTNNRPAAASKSSPKKTKKK